MADQINVVDLAYRDQRIYQELCATIAAVKQALYLDVEILLPDDVMPGCVQLGGYVVRRTTVGVRPGVIVRS